MSNKIKVILIVSLTVLALLAIAYITTISYRDIKETLLLNTLIVLVLSFSYLIIFRNAKEVHLARAKANYWKEKAILEEEARRSKSYLEAIYNNSSDLICLVKRDGTITYGNQQWKKVMGFEPEEMRGKSILTYIPEDEQNVVTRKWKDLNEINTSISYETHVVRNDRSAKPFFVSHSYIQKYDEYIVVMKDISEQKKLQENISSIHRLNRTLITIQDVEQLVQASLQTAFEILPFTCCDLFLFDEEKDDLVLYGFLGNSSNRKGQRIPLNRENRIASAFLDAREAINLSFGSGDEAFVPMSVREGSELYIPMMTKDKILGVFYLTVREDDEFIEESLKLLSELASQTAVAIENARLSQSIVESEEKYRGVVDNIGIGISLLSPGREILSLNNRMRKWFPDIDILQKPLCYRSYFDPPQERGCIDCPVERTLSDGKIHESIINIHSADEVKNYRVVASPIKGNDGETIAAIEMVEDITEQIRMEKALKESEHRFRTIFDSSVDGILLTNLETKRFVTGNRAVCAMLGYAAEEIEGLDVHDIYPEEKLDHINEQLEKQERGEVTISKEIAVKKKDGSVFYADINTVPMTLGGLKYLLGLFRDVTERKRIEDLIKKGKEEWERTFDTVPELIAIIGTDHTIKRLNRTMAQYIGRSYQEAIGMNYYEILYGAEEAPDYCPHVQLMQDMRAHQMEIRSDILGGDFLATASPLLDEDGKLKGSVFVALNITERKKAERALKDSEEKYRGVVEASLIGVFIVQDNVFQFVNNRFCAIFGYQNDEVADKLNLYDLIHPDDRDRIAQHLDELLSGTVETIEIELKSLRKGGDEFPARMLAGTLNYLGSPALIGSILDLSREKILELQLIRSQKMESMGHLAGGIAHDFNNVLGIIAGSLEILHGNGFDERSKKLMDMAMDAVERGSGIVKRLLMFSKADEIELAPVSLSTVINECIKILEHSLEKNIVIRKAIETAQPLIMGNKEQLIQVLLNICLNARDAMPSGGSITVQLTREDEYKMKQRFPNVQGESYYVLRITDNGIGMDESTREHIFEPFFTTKEREKGTGLGLAIVHGIISRHRGFIDVESAPGKGTTFSLYLPATEMRDEALLGSIEEEIQGGHERILIVDDEEYLREILKRQLIPLGYEVLEAKDGLEALSIFEKECSGIDLVILDIGMPVMSGEEVFLRMKDIDPDASIVLASGYLANARRAELVNLGVREFIQKPYSLKKIAIVIRKILDAGRGQAAEEIQADCAAIEQ